MERANSIIPDFRWYSAESKRLGLSLRCPFASVHACPRYYQSLALLGSAGSTTIPDEEDGMLTDRWSRHPLWPATREQETSLLSRVRQDATKEPSIFSKFCPEVLYDRFGYFATGLSTYPDEIDSGLAQERLSREGVLSNDPRWYWSSCTPQHFSECPLYSCLSHDWSKQIRTFASVLPGNVRYDVFISHASEDKEPFVRALAAELTRLGLRVWFDEWTLRIGDSLRKRIDEGLRTATFGVVILSPSFFQKTWPQAELDALFAIEMNGNKAILPVLFDMTHEQLAERSPLMSGKLATNAAKGVVVVAMEIHEVVRGSKGSTTVPVE